MTFSKKLLNFLRTVIWIKIWKESYCQNQQFNMNRFDVGFKFIWPSRLSPQLNVRFNQFQDARFCSFSIGFLLQQKHKRENIRRIFICVGCCANLNTQWGLHFASVFPFASARPKDQSYLIACSRSQWHRQTRRREDENHLLILAAADTEELIGSNYNTHILSLPYFLSLSLSHLLPSSYWNAWRKLVF